MSDKQTHRSYSMETFRQVWLFEAWNPIYLTGLTLILTWISNYTHYRVWGEIAYPFPNFNGATVEVW